MVPKWRFALMAQHDGTDGSQYDIIDPPWAEDRLLVSLEEALAAVDATEDPRIKAMRREIAISINADLVALHGIDLGPF
jgi:hypothetical protein